MAELIGKKQPICGFNKGRTEGELRLNKARLLVTTVKIQLFLSYMRSINIRQIQPLAQKHTRISGRFCHRHKSFLTYNAHAGRKLTDEVQARVLEGCVSQR